MPRTRSATPTRDPMPLNHRLRRRPARKDPLASSGPPGHLRPGPFTGQKAEGSERARLLTACWPIGVLPPASPPPSGPAGTGCTSDAAQPTAGSSSASAAAVTATAPITSSGTSARVSGRAVSRPALSIQHRHHAARRCVRAAGDRAGARRALRGCPPHREPDRIRRALAPSSREPAGRQPDPGRHDAMDRHDDHPSGAGPGAGQRTGRAEPPASRLHPASDRGLGPV
jgi:hypothetical protein